MSRLIENDVTALELNNDLKMASCSKVKVRQNFGGQRIGYWAPMVSGVEICSVLLVVVLDVAGNSVVHFSAACGCQQWLDAVEVEGYSSFELWNLCLRERGQPESGWQKRTTSGELRRGYSCCPGIATTAGGVLLLLHSYWLC